MARNDGRIEAGQKLAGAISAKAWNRAQDAADRVLGVGTGITGGGATGSNPAPNVVLIKNASGRDVPWLGVLGISGVEISPVGGNLTGNTDADRKAREFASRPVLRGVAPLSSSHGWKIVVALEPIANGKIGRAAIGGAFACKVFVAPEASGYRYATIKDGDITQLAASNCGPVFLAWMESGTGQSKWAVGVM
jgi:hypothetical protein